MLNGLAREFGVFDHWFCEVPSQTFMNRSFWTAATCTPLPTGGTTNTPIQHWVHDNTAETLFDRLEAHGRTWKVYVDGPTRAPRSPDSSTGRGCTTGSPPTSCRSPSSRRTLPPGTCPTSR